MFVHDPFIVLSGFQREGQLALLIESDPLGPRYSDVKGHIVRPSRDTLAHFQGRDIGRLVAEQDARLRQTADRLGAELVDEDVEGCVGELVDAYTLRPLVLQRDRLHVIKSSEPLPEQITFAVPFSGQPGLFDAQPTEHLVVEFPGRVVGQELWFEIRVRRDNPTLVRAEAESWLNRYEVELKRLAADVEPFNRGLEERARGLVTARKIALQEHHTALLGLGLPISGLQPGDGHQGEPEHDAPLAAQKRTRPASRSAGAGNRSVPGRGPEHSGAKTIPDGEREIMELAIAKARESRSEPDKISPKVGTVVVRDGEVLGYAFRGELDPRDHAEFTLLEKKLCDVALSGATLYTTLEPCTSRGPDKIPCAERIIERRIRRVVIGVLDPNPTITGSGELRLTDAGIEVLRFPPDLMRQIEELDRLFRREHSARGGSTAGRRSQPARGLPESTALPALPPAEHHELASVKTGGKCTCGRRGLIANIVAHKALWDIVEDAVTLYNRYVVHPIGAGQEAADLSLRDELEEWKSRADAAIGSEPERAGFEAPPNTSGMDNRIQVPREQLRQYIRRFVKIARERDDFATWQTESAPVVVEAAEPDPSN